MTWPPATHQDVQDRINRVQRVARIATPYRINHLSTHPSPPTVAENSTGYTVTSNYRVITGADTNLITFISGSNTPSYNMAAGYSSNLVNSPSDTDQHWAGTLIGTTVEFNFRVRYTDSTNPPQYWIFVDGLPLSASPTTSAITTYTSGGGGYLKLTFATAGAYDIRVYTRNMGLSEFRIPITEQWVKTRKKPWTIAWITDSFGDENAAVGTPSAFQIFPRRVSFALGAEFLQSTQPGSGYTVGGASSATFGDAQRLSALAAGSPDLIVVVGGCNDWNSGSPNYSAVSTAVTNLLTSIASTMPGVPVIVAGPQALQQAQTISSAYATLNNTIRTAALAQPNCLGHIDMIGNAATGTVPAALNIAGTWNVGDYALYNNAIVQAYTAGSNIQSWQIPRYWSTVSWLDGSGKVGSTAGDGNRDTFLGSDGTHPSLAGQANLTGRLVREIQNILGVTGANTI